MHTHKIRIAGSPRRVTCSPANTRAHNVRQATRNDKCTEPKIQREESFKSKRGVVRGNKNDHKNPLVGSKRVRRTCKKCVT